MNGNDELEILQNDIASLEICADLADLIETGSHRKARAAIIILHHLAEILLYRECQELLEWDRSVRWVMEPRFTRSERTKVLMSFADKVFLVRDKATHLSLVDEAVLLVSPMRN
jgi:hypothetical protein